MLLLSLVRGAGIFTALSREVYIVFYSDSSVSGNGFSLTWKSIGEQVRTGSDVTTQFSYFKSDNGSATSISNKATFTSSLYQVFIFTPLVPSTYNNGLQLQLNQTMPAVVGGNGCIKKLMTILIPVNGMLRNVNA